MEVVRISEERVKPSSPTPLPLKTYNFCLLDQFIPPVFFPMTLFYSNQHPRLLANNLAISKRSLLLRQSLSKTLTLFYPLAGKIRGELSIDCNDDGVPYIQARANIPLHEYLSQIDLASICKLLPEAAAFHHSSPGSCVAMIQETTFACGGITIGVCVSHMFMDGTSLSSFLKHWATATTSGHGETILHPNLVASSIFPQHNPLPTDVSFRGILAPFVRKGKVVTRRFLFDDSAVGALKAKANRSSVENPTRVEVVSAILLKCIRAVFNARSGISKATLTTHAVNLRRRAATPFSEYLIGNLIWRVTALTKPEETMLSGIISVLREAITTKVNNEFVKKIQGDGGFIKLYEEVKEIGKLVSGYSGVECVSMTSWCNFGLYNIDFGWGKPVWASSLILSGGDNIEIPYMNTVVLMDTKSNKGIEAWVIMSEEEMDMLENEEELLAYASVDPNPIASILV